MVKAQHNRNLSPETKSVIKQLEVEVTEMIDDSNTFLNSNTILSLKSKNRFAKQSLLDIEKGISSGSGANTVLTLSSFEDPDDNAQTGDGVEHTVAFV